MDTVGPVLAVCKIIPPVYRVNLEKSITNPPFSAEIIAKNPPP